MGVLTEEETARATAIGRDDQMREIVRLVSDLSGIEAERITGPQRDAQTVLARDLVIHCARRVGISQRRVGEAVNRDRSSIRAAVRREEGRRG